MDFLIRTIVYSDNSKEKFLVVNSDKGCGRIKITQKQWDFFKKAGIEVEQNLFKTSLTQALAKTPQA